MTAMCWPPLFAPEQLIVTFNLKDFPADTLAGFGVEAVHPDTFLEQQFELNQGLVLRTAHRHRASLHKPPRSAEEYLDTLAACGLIVTADRLREFIDVL